MFQTGIGSSLRKLKAIEDRGYELTRWRVNEILLCSSYYDAFIFEQDGVLTEQLYGEYRGLNLSFPPRVRHAASVEEAMSELINAGMPASSSSMKRCSAAVGVIGREGWRRVGRAGGDYLPLRGAGYAPHRTARGPALSRRTR